MRNVPHRHVCITLPKMLRPYFKYDRSLLTELARWVYESLVEVFSQLADDPLRPGCLVVLELAGNLLDLNPHLHVLTSSGAFNLSGAVFYEVPHSFRRLLEHLIRRRVLRELRAKGLLSKERHELLLSWRHSGFGVFVGEPILPCQKANLERLARYFRRPRVADSLVLYDVENGRVILRSSSGLHPKHKANFRLFDAPDFVAALLGFLPDAHRHESIAYGEYSNAVRGRRRKAGETPCSVDVQTPLPSWVRARWRDLLKRILEVDPLECPKCGTTMKLLRAVTFQPTIERVLRHLGLWTPRTLFGRPKRAPPPAPDEPSPAAAPTQLDHDFSQIPTWWDADDSYSQVSPDGS